MGIGTTVTEISFSERIWQNAVPLRSEIILERDKGTRYGPRGRL